jgi:hypothetical protein
VAGLVVAIESLFTLAMGRWWRPRRGRRSEFRRALDAALLCPLPRYGAGNAALSWIIGPERRSLLDRNVCRANSKYPYLELGHGLARTRGRRVGQISPWSGPENARARAPTREVVRHGCGKRTAGLDVKVDDAACRKSSLRGERAGIDTAGFAVGSIDVV